MPDHDSHARADIQEGLRQFIVEEILVDGKELGDDDSLLHGGVISSFHLVQLAVFAEDTFGVRIPDEHLGPEHMDTLADMAAYVVARLR